MPAIALPPPTHAPPPRSAPTRPPTPSRRARSPAPLPHIFSVQSLRALPEPFSLHSLCKRPERPANACTMDDAAIRRHWLGGAHSESVLDSERRAFLQPRRLPGSLASAIEPAGSAWRCEKRLRRISTLRRCRTRRTLSLAAPRDRK